MIYTEYFARGTEARTFCDMHPTHGFMTKVAGLFGGQPDNPPPRVEEVVPPPEPPAATVGSQPEVQAPPEEPEKKKRGFWSRLFGIGKADDKNDEKSAGEKPSKKKKGGF
jgi:hypothetical protein